MADKLGKFEKKLQADRFTGTQIDPFIQVIARLPNNWVDTGGFDFAAGTALRLQPHSPVFAPIVRLFKLAGLRHEIPWHWPLLLGLIAWSVSQENRRPGARVKWTTKRMDALRADLATLRSPANYRLAAVHLQKKFSDKYGHLDPEYFRKVVARAQKDGIAPAILGTRAKRQNVDEQQVIDDLVTLIEQKIANEKALMKFIDEHPLG